MTTGTSQISFLLKKNKICQDTNDLSTAFVLEIYKINLSKT